MKHNFKILIIIALVLQSCEKENDLISQNCEANCTEIVGTLMTDDGSTPIANRKINVIWDNTSHGFGLIRTKASVRTDSDGNFNIKFYMRNDELNSGIHRMYFNKLNEREFLRSDLNGMPAIPSVRDTLVLRNHNVVKKAFMNLTLLNLEDMQGSDRLWTNFKYPRPIGFSQSITGTIRGWTSAYESSQVVETAGNQPVIIEIVRNVNGIITRENDTLFIAAGTTLDYTVDFNE